MFAALTGPVSAASTSTSSAAAAAAAACQGGRFEDELHIMLSKALSHVSPVYKRIGIVGNLAMLRREAAAYAAASEGAGPGEPGGSLNGLMDGWFGWSGGGLVLLRSAGSIA